MREAQELRCPECGGHAFGSMMGDDGKLTRYCHSGKWVFRQEGRQLCQHTWSEDDDHKHFVGVKTYESLEEYKAEYKRLNPPQTAQIVFKSLLTG